MKRYWKLGIVAVVLLALGGVAAGIVAAQTSGGTATPTEQSATATKQSATVTDQSATAPPGASSSATPTKKQQLIDDFLTKLAANLGISVDQLKQALTTTETQMLDQAVADGKITQAEADKIKARIASGDQIFPFGGRGHGRGFGFGFGFGKMASLDSVATFLGITVQDVTTGLQNNQSLADIAKAHGKAADELSNYLYDQLKSSLDTAVSNNKITQAQEDKLLSNAKTRIDNEINRVGPFHGPGNWGDDKGAPPNSATPSDSTPGGTANPTSL
jgi:uncharacterized protein YidB (DUF937 family)